MSVTMTYIEYAYSSSYVCRSGESLWHSKSVSVCREWLTHTCVQNLDETGFQGHSENKHAATLYQFFHNAHIVKQKKHYRLFYFYYFIGI